MTSFKDYFNLIDEEGVNAIRQIEKKGLKPNYIEIEYLINGAKCLIKKKFNVLLKTVHETVKDKETTFERNAYGCEFYKNCEKLETITHTGDGFRHFINPLDVSSYEIECIMNHFNSVHVKCIISKYIDIESCDSDIASDLNFYFYGLAQKLSILSEECLNELRRSLEPVTCPLCFQYSTKFDIERHMINHDINAHHRVDPSIMKTVTTDTYYKMLLQMGKLDKSEEFHAKETRMYKVYQSKRIVDKTLKDTENRFNALVKDNKNRRVMVEFYRCFLSSITI
jgi:hypothetical protein